MSNALSIMSNRNYLPLLLSLVFLTCACQKDAVIMEEEEEEVPTQRFLPESDPNNTMRWVLNEDISDEFENGPIDETKWLVQGRNGEYQSNFVGRAPSQFSTDNVRIEDGRLMLETRWEPDYPFSPEVDRDGDAYENYTTAAVISKQTFKYGYMEIRCKAADASITSSFWMTGNNTELDVFEFMGKPKQRHKIHLEKEYKYSIHDWAPGMGGPTVWTDKKALEWRVAGDFHTYGCEWNADGLKFYADGALVRSATEAEIEAERTADAGPSAWILTKPLYVWVDSETFPWHGLPAMEDLPVDFEIDYIRIWQEN